MVERILTAVELVPPGRVVTYGDLAELVGTSARRVGAIMSRYGAGVPWWRVVNAVGELPAELLLRADEHWAAEGISRAVSGRGCRIAAHRADLLALGEAYRDRRAVGGCLHDPDGRPKPLRKRDDFETTPQPRTAASRARRS